MAESKDKGKQDAAPAAEGKGQGRAVVLPNGELRAEFIRNRYYNDGISRSDIRKEINAMLPEDDAIPYQIVFASTKKGKPGEKEHDPRNKPKAEAAPAAAVKT